MSDVPEGEPDVSVVVPRKNLPGQLHLDLSCIDEMEMVKLREFAYKERGEWIRHRIIFEPPENRYVLEDSDEEAEAVPFDERPLPLPPVRCTKTLTPRTEEERRTRIEQPTQPSRPTSASV